VASASLALLKAYALGAICGTSELQKCEETSLTKFSRPQTAYGR
jgi:hypothetical protein